MPDTERALGMSVESVDVAFGSVRALAEISFDVAAGTIHAVIGPNGAGKSTLFNVLTGIYPVASGRVRCDGNTLTGMRPHQISNLGIARSFQNIQLSRASVADNIMLGRHALMRPRIVGAALRLPAARRDEALHRGRVAEIAEFLGLTEHLSAPADVLSYGDQKRVELARALASEPRLLLLDEPVAGMNKTERVAMSRLIRSLHSALDLTVVIVEHDMSMVMELADRCTVLDFGRVIADGTPPEIRRDPAVIDAYLGESVDDNPLLEGEPS